VVVVVEEEEEEEEEVKSEMWMSTVTMRLLAKALSEHWRGMETKEV